MHDETIIRVGNNLPIMSATRYTSEGLKFDRK